MSLFSYFKHNNAVTGNNHPNEFSQIQVKKKIEFYIPNYGEECTYVIYKHINACDIYIID